MAEVEQGKIGNLHGTEGIHAPQDDDEVIIGGDGPQVHGDPPTDPLDQEDPRYIMDLGDLKDPWDQ